MKRTLLAMAASLSVALSAHASLILSNSFDYADGSLISVSAGSPAGVWLNHSGTSGQVDVSAGKVNLTQSESEDVSTYFTNSAFPTPISTGKLYASFTVNFSDLPAGTGGYFWHFKDTGTSNFKARVFAVTNGVPGGNYRVGITVGGNTPVVVPFDMALSTDYKLVVRYNLDTTNATLWVNPNSEDSTVNRADASDASATVALYMVSLRQSLSSGNGMGTLTVDNLLVGTAFADVSTIGGPPTISAIANQTLAANTSTGPLAFQVNDVETPAANLTVTGTSANTTLVPNNPANIALGGSGVNRTVTITPVAGQQGTTVISLVVTDGSGLQATDSFLVTVGAPSIGSIADQSTPTNTPTAAIAFTVGDAETPNSLVVTASSSNPALVQDGRIVISGTGTSRTVKITPEPDQAGLATITLTVSDGIQSASTAFTLTVYPHWGLLLGDDFSYSDGNIVSSSGSFWVAHSGTSNDAMIVSQQLRLAGTNTDDVRAWFTNSASVPVTSGVLLYSKFTVNFIDLPKTSGGGYFAHFKDYGTSNYRARVFALTNGAPAGKFRLGISNGGFAVAAVPQDLDLNTTYTVVTRYNVGTGSSTIWVNPRSESSPSATATDPTTPIDIWNYAFRQSFSDNPGALLLDDLQIGTAFTDVLPYVAPPDSIKLAIKQQGNQAVLTWADPAFSLQSAPAVTGPYTTISGATSPYTNTIGGSQTYFRLQY